jgi:hypothetical protein
MGFSFCCYFFITIIIITIIFAADGAQGLACARRALLLLAIDPLEEADRDLTQ